MGTDHSLAGSNIPCLFFRQRELISHSEDAVSHPDLFLTLRAIAA